MSTLASRLTRKKSAATGGNRVAPAQAEGRPLRDAAKAVLETRYWYETEGKRRPKDGSQPATTAASKKSGGGKNSGNVAPKTTAAKNVSKAALPKKPAARKRKARSPTPEIDPKASADEDDPSDDDEDPEDEQDEDEESARPGHKNRREVSPLEDGFEEEEDFVRPQSRASNISLPPESDFLLSSDADELAGGDIIELDEDDADGNVASSSRSKRTISSSDDEENAVQPPTKKTRAEVFLAERPAIVAVSSSTVAKASKPAAAVKNQTAQAKITWPPETEYKPPSPGARLISKSGQNDVFGSLIEGATNNATALFLFECAFPEKTYKSRLLRDALVMAAQELNQTAIAKRIQHPSQKKYRTPLQDYIANRGVSHVRTDTRKAAATAILSVYPLTGRACPVGPFIGFICKMQRYIYPQVVPEPTTNAQPSALTAQVTIPAVAPPTPAAQNTTADPENGSGTPTSASTDVSGGEGDKANAPAAGIVAAATAVIPSTAVVPSPAAVPSTENASRAHYYLDERTLIKSKPYQNPAIITVLRSLFGGASKPGVVHEDLFVSSIEGKSGKEIPMAMLAMVAVMVHFCLREWAEGIRVSKIFESREARKEYNANIQVLSDLQERFPLKYHRLMSDLYKLATSAEAPSEDQTAFDFEGMED